MVELGSAALILALLAALFAVGAAIAGARGAGPEWVEAARRSVYALFGLLALAVVAIESSFLRTDLSLELVANHSSTTTPTLFKATAMWGSQAGSLLLWAFVLSAASSAVLYLTRNRHREIVPWAIAVLGGVATFFVGLMVAGIVFDGMDSWPFARNQVAPAEGQGLNPLLRHWAMAIHPPMLYSGYVFFTIPFAFAIGALVTRRVDAGWIRSTRRFALVAWTFLSAGLVLGAFWSYNELGWGGYWAWDPVENAALMPWLTGTAFLHSIQVQERRGMLKVWNASLIVATFSLALLGTFLVRSGILQSIHAFGESSVGPPLLGLIAVVILGSTALIVSRLPSLRSERRIDSLISRESFFFLNNLVLVLMAAVVFWGTFLPLITEAALGESRTIAAPWYDRFTTPLAIVLVLLAGIGPLAAWRRLSAASIKRNFAAPAAAALVAVVGLGLVADATDEPLALAMFGVGAFAATAVTSELVRGARARRALAGGGYLAAVGRTVTRNRRRYGGYTVHLGIVVMLAGVAASSSFQTSEDVRLVPGERAEVGDYTLTYERAWQRIDSEENKLVFGANLSVRRDGERVALLTPSRNYYSGGGGSDDAPIRSFFEGEATSEVGKQVGVGEDLWTAMQPDLSALDERIERVDAGFAALNSRLAERLGGEQALANPEVQSRLAIVQGEAIRDFAAAYAAAPPPADFRVNVNPFVIWVWIGALVAIGGALFGLWPAASGARRPVSDVYAARLARELGRA